MRNILFTALILIIGTQLKAQLLGAEQKWEPGKYYTKDGKAINGLINYETQEKGFLGSPGSAFIFYKTDREAKKKKIAPDSLKAFVIGMDSFVVSHFNELKTTPFLQVVVDKGRLKLYFSTVAKRSGSGMHMNVNGTFSGAPGLGSATEKTTSYYGEDPDHIKELDRKNFIDVMSQIMADKPDVVNDIQNKKYRLGSIYDLVSYYRTGILPAKKLDDAY